MSNGYYLMHRGWMDNPMFADEPLTEREAFEWLVSEAAFTDGRIVSINRQPIMLKRGQLSHSVRFMAEAWGWKQGKVQRYIEHLKKWNAIDTQTDTGQLVITICNYAQYQDNDTQTDTPSDKKTVSDRYKPDTNITNVNQDNQLSKYGCADETSSPPTPEKKPRGITLEGYFKSTGLPEDELAPDEWFDWARAEYPSIPPPEIISELEKFRDWAKANANRPVAKKVDWLATWRNWFRGEAPKISLRLDRAKNGQGFKK